MAGDKKIAISLAQNIVTCVSQDEFNEVVVIILHTLQVSNISRGSFSSWQT